MRRIDRATRNKGFSLVELIIIISIMAVVSAGAIWGLGILPKRQVNSAAERLAMEIQKTKTSALSFESAEIKIYKEGSDFIAKVSEKRGASVKDSMETIGSGGVLVSYETMKEGVTEEKSITGDSGEDCLVLSFDRSSGAFKPQPSADSSVVYCTAIVIKKGSYEKRIELIPLTGKVVLN